MFRIVSGVYDILLDEIMHRFAERSGFFFSSHCGVPRTSTRLSDVRRAVAAAAAPPCPLQERAVKGEPCHRTRRIAPDAYRPLVLSLTFLTRWVWHSLRSAALRRRSNEVANSCSRLRLASGP